MTIQNSNVPATPVKLQDGSWGARTRSPVIVGDIVTVTTRAGKTWDARVERIVADKGGEWLCATQSVGRSPRKASPRSRGTRTSSYSDYCGYSCPVSGLRCCAKNGPCHDCM